MLKSTNLLTLLTSAIERTSEDAYIGGKVEVAAKSVIAPLIITSYVFDVKSSIPLYIPKTHVIKSVRNGRLIGGMDLIKEDDDLSKVSIYPVLTKSNICIKYNVKGSRLHITGCKSEEDIRVVLEYLGSMSPKNAEIDIISVSGATNLGSKVDLVRLSLDLSRRIASPVSEPTKSRLTINNINNMGVSLTFFSKGSAVIVGESVRQVEEMYKLICEWVEGGAR